MKILLSFLLAFTSTVFAQVPSSTVQTVQEESKPLNTWVEITIPFTRNNGFADALEDADKRSNGSWGVSVGWQPLKNSKSSSMFTKIFRNVGVSANLTENSPPDFSIPLFTTIEPLSLFEENTKCVNRGNQYCDYCTTNSIGVYQKCLFTRVMGRETYVKYAQRSVAIGLYLPVDVAEKLLKRKVTLAGGVNMRIHFLKEGNRSDEMENSTAVTYAATFKVSVPVYKNISASAGYEHSFYGSKIGGKRFQSRTVYGGVTLVW